MTDLNLNTQEVFDQLEDIDESWALQLLDECEQEIHVNSISDQETDDQEIHVEQADPSLKFFETEQITDTQETAEEPHNNFEMDANTTAIERQIRTKAEQANSEPSNAKKVAQGFWSFFKRNKTVS